MGAWIPLKIDTHVCHSMDIYKFITVLTKYYVVVMVTIAKYQVPSSNHSKT